MEKGFIMNATTEAKNTLAQCRNKNQLHSVLIDLCDQSGFNYNQSRNLSYNVSRAREQQRYDLAEVIKHAETLEQRL